jgi:hypothetical protein
VKAHPSTALALVLAACCALQAAETAPTAPPSAPAETTPAARPKPTSLVKYKPKAGKDPGGVERSFTAATRSGKEDLRLVALTPGRNAATLLPQPVLWWHQSGPTTHGELQLTVTNMSGSRPATLFSAKLTARPAGYQSVDLADPTVNPRGLKLEPDITYQWSVVLTGADRKTAVYATLKRTPDPVLEKALKEAPDDPATLEALAAAGNWHELFGRIAALAKQYPDEPAYARNRDALLADVKLLDAIKAKR